jgi:cell wall-associated NlpC family hydrolase
LANNGKHYPGGLTLWSLWWLAVLALVSGCSGTATRGDLTGARQEVVMNALAQVGTPYRFGGTSPAGFDCSGLVQYTHLAAGVRVPRTTKAQKKASQRVRGARRQPGDLLFFRIGFNRYHVGILVDDERFVHAPSSGKRVQLSRIDNPYWEKRLRSTATFLN